MWKSIARVSAVVAAGGGILWFSTFGTHTLEWLRQHDRPDFRTVVGTLGVARAARVGGLPITLLVRRDGVVSEIFAGYWPERDRYVHDAVEGLLERKAKSSAR